MRNAFAHVHACECAALTRSHGSAARAVQGDVPRRRHEGPQLFDPMPGTTALRVNFCARQHSVQVGMKVRFVPRPACTCSPLNIFLRSTRCSMAPRRRRAPSPRPRAASRAALRRGAARFSTTWCSSRCCRYCCRSLGGGLELRGGGCGGFSGAAVRRLAPGGSGAPPARLRRLRRRLAARRQRLVCLCCCAESREASAHLFSDCAIACGARVRGWIELTLGFPTV